MLKTEKILGGKIETGASPEEIGKRVTETIKTFQEAKYKIKAIVVEAGVPGVSGYRIILEVYSKYIPKPKSV